MHNSRLLAYHLKYIHALYASVWRYKKFVYQCFSNCRFKLKGGMRRSRNNQQVRFGNINDNIQ